MKTIEYYFDFLSPYSYLAWHWVKQNEKKYNFIFKPAILGKVIHYYETKGPAEIEPKRNYLFKDCLRKAALADIPFVTPKKLPFNSLYALRLALPEIAGDRQFEVIDAIFSAGWSNGQDIGEPDVLNSLLNDLGMDGNSMLDHTGDRDVRAALKSNVKEAIAKGVFGFPAFIVDDELFWGNDSIRFLEMFINKNDPMDEEKYNNFVKMFNEG